VRKQPARPGAQRDSPFGCVQLEFGFLLGPPDGRYLVRRAPDGVPEAVLVLGTLGAPERHWLRDRRPREVDSAPPEPVPTSRATVVRPEPFPTTEAASAWLDELRRDADAREDELGRALEVLNRALRAQRAAAADPYVADVSAGRALVVRMGYGQGEAVADGRFGEAFELPRSGPRRVRRSMEAPEQRFAAILGGHETPLAAEELVLRARADLDAGRDREAALQARVAVEALIAETGETSLEEHREVVIQATAAALAGRPYTGLEDALAAMEEVLRRRRLGG
jgi:hypothetical protein